MSYKVARFGFWALSGLQFFLFLAVIQRPAYGYVDPGSGLLVVQFAASALSAAVFFLRQRIRQLFHFGKRQAPTEQQPGETKS